MNTRTLTATLPSDAVYVSGTVNGVATTWTNTHDTIWETVAERSETDVYFVVLTIINAFGTTSESAFTLYYGLHLVTDRTSSDVAYARRLIEKLATNTITASELAEWDSAMLKGSYNASDLNRVGSAMLFVAERFNSIGYAITVTPTVTWLESDIPTVEDVQHYLHELSVLRGALVVMTSTPKVPSTMSQLSYVEANNIEKILEDIDILLTRIMQAWYYSAEVFSGEV